MTNINVDLNNRYTVSITDMEKFLAHFTNEEYRKTFYTFDDTEEILAHLIQSFHNAPELKQDTKYFKYIEGFDYLFFDNNDGWLWDDDTVKENGFSLVIKEPEEYILGCDDADDWINWIEDKNE